MKRGRAEVLREYGPFEDAPSIGGVTYDGERVWFAAGERLAALDPDSGAVVGAIDVAAHAGTAFDGRHIYQIAGDVIRRIDPASGALVATIPAPGRGGDSGLAYAEGALYVGQYRERCIHEIDPQTGDIRRTIRSDRFVTGVSFVGDEFWHATWEDEASEIRRIDPASGAVLETLEMPDGLTVSGLESDGGERFFCGGGSSGKVRVVRRPRQG
jgi:streptogramin lyase